MSDAVLLAIVVPLMALLTLLVTGRQAKAAEQRGYRRQDEVAARLEAANSRVERRADQANGKLDIIHSLVNSTLTESMQDRLDVTVELVALQRRMIARDVAAGLDADEELAAAYRATERRLTQLRTELGERAAAAAAAAPAVAADQRSDQSNQVEL